MLLFAPIVNAKSGCCSGHEGVNCGGGSQLNGNVVCNDGWKGSSCKYSEMVMCRGTGSPTNRDEAAQAVPQPVIPTPSLTPDISKKVIESSKKPGLSSSDLKKQRCESALKKIHAKISTQEQKKEKNLTQLNKILTTLDEKIATLQSKNQTTITLSQKFTLLQVGILEYQAVYDTYTNKLYEISWSVCSENSEKLSLLLKEEVALAKPLSALFLSLKK